ncbi:DNA-N1-methyladenine dioxygenase [Nitrosospira sp. Nsp2]|nr:DNA-N1-methyladenine dioxygenase [Nitrosospira sp. Nsp2]
MMTLNLFEDLSQCQARREELSRGAVVLRAFALPDEAEILTALGEVVAEAPLRHMVTPGGFRMSVALTNCGSYGWVTDHTGYRYQPTDPDSGKPWPRMPDVFRKLARDAAATAGFENFEPDACLVNLYEPGARLSLHQDKNERDFNAPIVSVSLGLPAVFMWGGLRRQERPARVQLAHGDVMVWGGPARLCFHGVLPLADGCHHATGGRRINLTFRKAA